MTKTALPICLMTTFLAAQIAAPARGDAMNLRPDAVFRDAVAVWRMDDKQTNAVEARGEVRLGVPLAGAERAACLARGGSGSVAELTDGYLAMGSPALLAPLQNARAMTLVLRVCAKDGAWKGPLLAIDNPTDHRANLLYGAHTDVAKAGFAERARMGGGETLEFQWRTDPSDKARGDWGTTADLDSGVLKVAAPVGLIGARGWHDVVIRFTGPRLEMLVDGVLVDEEWPHGALTGLDSCLLIGAGYESGKLVPGFRGRVDYVAAWNRALSDDEVAALCGGGREIARRDREILGPERKDAQYWRPRGYNTFVGDAMAFYHEGRLHVYYLYDRRHHGSKWGAGAHQFGHMSTTDLVHWEHHPMALPITDQTECSLGTGCFVYRDGVYYLYYIQHGRRIRMKNAPYEGDNIFLATSTDGVHFHKRPEPVIPIRYDHGGDTNPHVVLSDQGDRYVMTISGWKVFTSTDLLHWAEADLPQLSAIKWICTTDIAWNGWRYFTGCGEYVMSRQPIAQTTTWVQPPSHALKDFLGVPVVCEFTGNRRLLIGFAGGPDYAQELIFRELVQEPDGSLGMKWPAEMIPRTGKALAHPIEAAKGEVSVSKQGVRVAAVGGAGAAMIRGVPQNARVTVVARVKAGTRAFGLCCRGTGAFEDGCELRIQPAEARMAYRRVGMGDGPSMDHVPGLDGEVTIDLIVKDDLTDVCVNGRRTLLNRTDLTGDRLFLFVEDGEVEFTDVRVRPLSVK